jgi:hypothetical protein
MIVTRGYPLLIVTQGYGAVALAAERREKRVLKWFDVHGPFKSRTRGGPLTGEAGRQITEYEKG